MSLTSYRAAPPRVWGTLLEKRGGGGLAATYSSAACAAVPSALRVFTAEFGMGSGAWPLAMATRPAPATSVPAQAGSMGLCHVSGSVFGCAAACVWIPAPAFAGTSLRGRLPLIAGNRVLPLHAGGVRRKGVPPRHQAPVERLVPVSCAGCPASTSGLSTWWSSTALGRDLVLRRVSRLDAFSGYPVRT